MSFHKSSYHKSCVLSLFIFRGYSTREPVSSRVTCFILRAYTGTGVGHSQRRKKSGEVLDDIGETGIRRRWGKGRRDGWDEMGETGMRVGWGKDEGWMG